MARAVVGAQREIIISAALPVRRLTTLVVMMMMVVRVVYAAAVLDRARWQSGRRRCQSEAWIICIDNCPLPT